MHSPDGFPCHIHHRHSSGTSWESPRACAVTLCRAVVGRRHARAARARIIFYFLFFLINLLFTFIFILKPHPDSLSVVSRLGRPVLTPRGGGHVQHPQRGRARNEWSPRRDPICSVAPHARRRRNYIRRSRAMPCITACRAYVVGEFDIPRSSSSRRTRSRGALYGNISIRK
jgi:hypothetical protein